MKYLIGFVFGVVVGAVTALLLAPYSGEQMRQNLKSQADTQYARLQEEVQKGRQEMQTRIDKLSTELKSRSGAVSTEQSPE